MRPARIIVEGFSAYRQRVEVDLDDVEYFSLTGSTGSGKSSLIDAMVFALYGRIPRLGGGSVAPVISAGAERARVSLDFILGEDRYTVARLVQRTKSGGASVTEARLQSGDEVLASGAGDVTQAVTDLLRLGFEDFTRTVVLPQGEFARFLTAKPSERQQLLRGLLGLDVYGRVRGLAASRESIAQSRAQEARTRLDTLGLPTDDVVGAAKERSDLIDQLAQSMPAVEAELARRQGDVDGLQRDAERLGEAVERLKDLAAPPHLEELGQLIYGARQELDEMEGRRERLKIKRAELELLLADQPSLEKIHRLQIVVDRISEVDAKLSAVVIEDVELQLRERETAATQAVAEVERARADLESARVSHSAHDLASALSVGDPCPVCQKIVDSALDAGEAADLEAIRTTVSVAEEGLELVRKEVSALTNTLVTLRSDAMSLTERRNELVGELGGFGDPAGLQAIRLAVEESTAELESVTSRLQELESPIKSKRREFEDLAEQQRSLGNRLMSQRESLADLRPTPVESDDPLVQWKELLAWRDLKVGEVAVDIEERGRRVAAAIKELEGVRTSITDKLHQLEIPVDGPYAVAVVRAQEQARHLVERHRQLEQDSHLLSSQLEKAEQEAGVAHSLNQHLRADGFERWLMAGAISDLVAGANELLAQLSGDGYSLVAEAGGSFDVIDHRNADESRSIATLSGGETFLVSLALALSLAETLSAAGGSGLDAIILDEGFGTLDDELLEVVASVLEDLAGSGLMVGIITHVKELAGLASVRYRVTKQPDGSTVELVS